MKNLILIFLAGISLWIYSGCKTADIGLIYFEANSVVMLEQSQPVLDNIGQKMKSDPALNIRLLNYYAPPLTTEWQILRDDGTPAISAARAEYVVEYLEQSYGINETRIHTEYKDIKDMPKAKDKDKDIDSIYRCIEITFESDKK